MGKVIKSVVQLTKSHLTTTELEISSFWSAGIINWQHVLDVLWGKARRCFVDQKEELYSENNNYPGKVSENCNYVVTFLARLQQDWCWLAEW